MIYNPKPLLFTIPIFAVDDFAGNCLEFDGVDDHIAIADDSSLDISNQITLETWIYVRSHADYPGIIAKGYETIGGYSLHIRFNGTLFFDLAESDGTRHSYNPTSETIPLNEWVHIAATYDGITQRIFFNAIEVI